MAKLNSAREEIVEILADKKLVAEILRGIL